MLELEEALARILSTLPAPELEQISLAQAQGRVLARQVFSPLDLPGFDNSAMDGYAVRAKDVAAACRDRPVRLRLCGKAAAGAVFDGEVGPGTCVRLFTGSPLPRGADAVAIQEDTRVEGNEPDGIYFLDSVKPWENVRLRGEDVRRGSALGKAGDYLTVGRVSLLAAVGLTQVTVGRRPVVGLLSTGSELREAGQALSPGQIYESNRLSLAALILQAGGSPKIFPLVPDSLVVTRAALESALGQCDAVVTTGGVSVGEMDFIKGAFEQSGGELQFWKIAIRPGRPFVFGRRKEKVLFGLPGNPVSALVTFLLLVRPALARWQGAAEVRLPAHSGRLADPLNNRGERRHFMRVTIDHEGKVRSAGVQASHCLGSLAVANGLVDVPASTTLAPGTIVNVLRWE